jgi:hypothetical protein
MGGQLYWITSFQELAKAQRLSPDTESEGRVKRRLLKVTSSLCLSSESFICSNEREYYGFETVV